MDALQEKVARLWPHLDERARRLFAASEARELGYGGVTLMSQVCGLSRVTIRKGLRELEETVAKLLKAMDYNGLQSSGHAEEPGGQATPGP